MGYERRNSGCEDAKAGSSPEGHRASVAIAAFPPAAIMSPYARWSSWRMGCHGSI